MKKVILFDMMNTLLKEPFNLLFERMFTGREERQQFLRWKDREVLHEFERGEISEQEHNRRYYLSDTPKEILKQLPRPALIKKELLRNLQYLPGMKPLLIGLQADPNVHVGIASNYSSWYESILKQLPEIKECDYLFFSCEMGIRKPSPDYYRTISASLKKELPHKTAKDILFIDDREVNLEPARSLGWKTHLMQEDSGGLAIAITRFLERDVFLYTR